MAKYKIYATELESERGVMELIVDIPDGSENLTVIAGTAKQVCSWGTVPLPQLD